MSTSKDLERFYSWMIEVDNEISKRTEGMISSDLPDCDYWDWFAAAVTPKRAAIRAIKNAYTY